MRIEDLNQNKIAVVGMGVNNRHLAEYFRRHKVAFEIIDGWKSVDELAPKLAGFDIIFRTPGLPYLSDPIQKAKKAGAEIYSQTKLFFDLCPCAIIGVTGTKGKGTTASLIYKILDIALRGTQGKVYLAGNIGQDPFEFIDEIKSNDLVVLELSSFQLQDMEKSPHIAVVLKTTSEHLDHHKSVEEYRAAKANIVAHQTENDFAILNYDSEVAREMAKLTPAKIYWNSTQQAVKPGSYVQDNRIFINQREIMPISEVGLTGRFNLENITAALAAVAAAGVTDIGIIRKVVSEFRGLEHRLEFVAEIKDVKFYNDSFSTTPESTIAALSAFVAPMILIVGGSEKHSDYEPLAQAIAQSRVRLLVPIGVTGPRIAAMARKAGYEGRISEKTFSNMQEIVDEANRVAQKGDIVLLSPAAASFGLFTDYKHRGEMFKKYVIIKAH